MTLLEQIPGLRAAIEQEQLVRDSSFLELPESVCGFDVSPLTLRHVLALEAIGSPFICGGQPLPHDFAAFLLTVKPARGFARWNMLRRLGQVEYGQAFEEISGFIGDAMQDSPGGAEVQGDYVSYYSFGASFVDCLAKEYGWSEAAILDMPLKRLFQYLKVISRRNGETTFFNPSDKVRGKWLAQLNKN